MVAPGVATCQVCYDETDAVITQICGASCSAVLCASCINAYVGFQAASALYGVVAQLKCPICLRPASLVRWREKLSKPNAHLQLLETKVHSACNVACPSCHTNTSVLPEACDSVQPLSLPTHLAQQMPELQARCGQYCHHRHSADAVYDYVRATFPGHDDVILSALLSQIYDVERRATLFLRWRRDAPFITSPCCKAALCFTCQVDGHHLGQPCAPIDAIDDIAQCPGCKLHLVKGDGCDSMNCFCGTPFSWTTQRRTFQLQSVRPAALAALRRLVHRQLLRIRWSIALRQLPASEAYYRSHLAAAARVALPDRLAPWLGGNGIHLGMSFDALAALKSDLWTPNMPITAVELPNYMARCVCCRLENVAELFPCLPPTATYDSASRISFVFDPTSQLRLVSLVLGVCYMPQWEPPTNAPLRTYFSTLLHGAATDQDAIVDHGHTVVSLETDDTLLVEFVDPRAPPEIDGRAFTLYFKRRREDIIRAMCQQRPVRQAMRAVQRHLRKLVWKRKWDIVLAAIQAMGEARR